MRGAPQVGFSAAKRRINSRRPELIEGRLCADAQVQYLRKPARCHWITVSGFTKTSTSDHLAHSLRNVTQNSRSAQSRGHADRCGLGRRAAAGEPGSQSRDQFESGARRGRSRREVERGGT